MNEIFQTIELFTPLIAWVAIMAITGLGDTVSHRTRSIPTFIPEPLTPDLEASFHSRLFLMKGLYGASTTVLLIGSIAVAGYGGVVILDVAGLEYLILTVVIAVVLGVYFQAAEIDPTTNKLLITSGTYTRWPDLERVKDRMAGLGAAAITVLVAAVTIVVAATRDWVAEDWGQDPISIERARSIIELLVILGAVMLVAGVLHVAVIHRAPAALIGEHEAKLLSQVAAGVTTNIGLTYSLELIAVYLGAMLVLNDWAVSIPSADISPSFIAMAGPAIAGIGAALSARIRRRIGNGLPKEEGTDSASSTRLNQLALMTYNTSLVGLPTWLTRFAGTPPFVKERFAALPNAIRRSGAEIVALQEVFGREKKVSLAAQLIDDYPYAFWNPTLPALRFDAGLMIFSRHPIVDAKFIRLEANANDEKYFVKRGFLSVVMELPGDVRLRVITYHTAAGKKPESAAIEAVRKRQIEQILAHGAEAGEDIVVLMGDLNAGYGVSKDNPDQVIGVSKINYDIVTRHQALGDDAPTYVDLMEQFPPDGGPMDLITWDSQGTLSCNGVHSFQNPQTIDHIFVSRRGLERVTQGAVSVILKQATVPVSSREGEKLMVPVSDHNAVLATIQFDQTR